ncbi:ABC-2 type transport system permease protein [Roseivirga pacifica]|uniref:ABC-2 type transport system permease protein n=1 Tax=Roseivirga pacifica TaxID=1267423 RepID=A0A1I0NFU5_9BACT|nr:ABC transporter permease [Roseivirga pacifica]RKQ51144.1 ABC-2 type transport system permease protein [Roseivirga pacifica]SEV99898.1 ABC-2 type transport system permease protein [Roseivirga pacifica]
MNSIFLVLKREYLTRVKKKSFLLTTILTPLIFPAIIFTIVYFATREKESRSDEILVIDESGLFSNAFDITSFQFTYIDEDVAEAKKNFGDKGAFGLLYLPNVDVQPDKIQFDGFEFYSKTNASMGSLSSMERAIRGRLEDLKLDRSGLDKEVIDNLKVSVSLNSFNITDAGESKKSNSKLSFAIGYGTGFLIYMFIFVYGSQIMQSVLDEKTSRIVEVIVSSVRPFNLMLGKVLGVGAVGFTQLLIWFVLIGVLSTAGLTIMSGGGSDAIMEAASQQVPAEAVEMTQQQVAAAEIQEMIASVPVVKILACFLFFFLGAYFLYGALYAAIGSAVDSIQDAQQFMFPIILPILAAIMSMFFVLEDPNGGLAVTLSLIPFTSPIIMMARIPFGVPDWQLALSMVLLIAGFIGTIWMAGRVYRIGILMYGAKVNWKTISKWFTMKV